MMRLDKYLAEMGEGTRQEVKAFIRKGRVMVNGVPVKKPEAKVEEGKDQVTLDGRKIPYQKYLYYMLNKPAGVITATTDAPAQSSSVPPKKTVKPPATRTVRYIMPWKNMVPAWKRPMAL